MQKKNAALLTFSPAVPGGPATPLAPGKPRRPSLPGAPLRPLGPGSPYQQKTALVKTSSRTIIQPQVKG